MKIHIRFALMILFGLLSVDPGMAGAAGPAFSIDLMSPSKQNLYVDDAWQPTAECIQAKVSVTADAPFKETVLRAYFFTAEGKLVDTVERPSPQADGNGGMVKTPSEFKAGKKFTVFFGIPDKAKTGADKWKRAIVVFGTASGSYDVKIYPKDDLAKFDFPEKASMKK